MHKRRLGAALFAVLAIAAVLAGCGGGSDSTSGGATTGGGSTESESSGSAPTKAAFIKEADKICGESNAAMSQEITDFAKEKNIPIEKEEPSTDQQVEIYEAVVLPNVAEQGEEIAALTPPEGEEEAVEEITDSLASGVEDAEGDPQQLTEGKDPLADATKKAAAFGMKTCGQG